MKKSYRSRIVLLGAVLIFTCTLGSCNASKPKSPEASAVEQPAPQIAEPEPTPLPALPKAEAPVAPKVVEKTSAEKAEAERVVAAKAAEQAAAKAEADRVAAEKVAAQKAEAARIEAEKTEAARIAAIRAAEAREAADKAAAVKLEAEKAEAARVAAAKAEAAKIEAARVAAAKAEADKATAAKAEAARVEAARVEAARVAAAKAEADRVAAAKVAADKAAVAKAEIARVEAARIEAARVASVKAEAARVAAVKAEADKVAAANAEAARVEAARVEAARVAAAKVEADRVAAAKVEAARIEAAKAEVQRLATMDVAEPRVVTAGGVSAGPVSVTIALSQKEALASFTTDGSEPSATNGKRYEAPFTVTESTVVRVRAFIPGGKSSAVIKAEYTIGEVCGAPGGSGDGRRGAPLGSVAAAVQKAISLGIGTVKLSSGSFTESLTVSSPLRISGGWNADFTVQGLSRTKISGKAGSAATKKAPAAALVVTGATADAKLVFERMEFRGGEASYSAGILVDNKAAPEFVDCAAYGGFGSYGYGAVALGDSAPVFYACRLDGGEGATSYGLSVDSARAILTATFALAGTGTVGGYGLATTAGSVIASSCVLAGNAANVSYGAAFYNSKESRLENCTVVGGSGKDVSGVFISASNPSIENCIISASGSGKSFGITANYGESAPSRLAGTVFLGAAGGLYSDVGSKTVYAALDGTGRLKGADGKSPSKPQGDGNSKGLFTLGNAPGFETPASASLPSVKVLSGASSQDIRGKQRTEPRRPGAY